MPEIPTNAAVETETAAPAKAATKKAAAKKATKKTAAAKKGAKKAPAKAAKKAAGKKAPSGEKKVTVRVRALKALAKKPMTAAQTAEAIGLGHGLKPTLDQEVERGHLTHAPNEDSNAVTYKLTAKGKAALEKGTVDPPRGAT